MPTNCGTATSAKKTISTTEMYILKNNLWQKS